MMLVATAFEMSRGLRLIMNKQVSKTPYSGEDKKPYQDTPRSKYDARTDIQKKFDSFGHRKCPKCGANETGHLSDGDPTGNNVKDAGRGCFEFLLEITLGWIAVLILFPSEWRRRVCYRCNHRWKQW